MLECMIIGDSIAVGVSQQRQECITLSENGINSANWLLVASGTTSNLNKVIFANATFAAVGSSGKILTSHDAGVTWVTQTSGTTENLNSITFNIDKQKWVIVGDNNTILESSDTVTWVPLLSKIVSNCPAEFNTETAPDPIYRPGVSLTTTLALPVKPYNNLPY
mgnify:CR=1 FL=1